MSIVSRLRSPARAAKRESNTRTCMIESEFNLREWRARVLADVAGLSPAYFGMVMATGIVGLGAHLMGMPTLAAALFRLNIFVYGVLWVLTLLRIARYPRFFFDDMVDHLR